MVALIAADGRVVADISKNTDEVISKIVALPSRPHFRYTQHNDLGLVTLKDECDLTQIKDVLYSYEEPVEEIKG